MSATKTVAALVLVLGTLVASPVQADRLRDPSWRWTTWNTLTGRQPSGTLSNLPTAAAPVPPPSTPIFTAPVVVQAPAPVPVPVFTPIAVPTFTPLPLPVQSGSADNWQNSSMFAVTNPNPTPVTPAVAAPTMTRADAFINLGDGPYPNASLLTTGNAQAWYNSPIAAKVFGGTPNAQQRADFSNEVLTDVRGVYSRSGFQNINFTTDPSVQSAHALSVVSGVSYGPNANVIGITNVGQSGVSLIDKLSGVNSVDQLATAVANNVAHELMHAFGVAEHPDPTSTHVDAADATWQTLTDPNATLSKEAVQAILAHEPINGLNAFSNGVGAETVSNGGIALEILAPTPVPEPSTIALWSLIGLSGIVMHRRNRSGRLSS